MCKVAHGRRPIPWPADDFLHEVSTVYSGRASVGASVAKLLVESVSWLRWLMDIDRPEIPFYHFCFVCNRSTAAICGSRMAENAKYIAA